MQRILDCADRYIEARDWKMVSILKFCLASIGVLLGLSIPGKSKKAAGSMAAGVFLVTYIALMVDFLTFTVDFFRSKEDK